MLKYILIGYGQRGRFYADCLRKLNRAEPAAVCDTRQCKLDLAKRNLGLRDGPRSPTSPSSPRWTAPITRRPSRRCNWGTICCWKSPSRRRSGNAGRSPRWPKSWGGRYTSATCCGMRPSTPPSRECSRAERSETSSPLRRRSTSAGGTRRTAMCAATGAGARSPRP